MSGSEKQQVPEFVFELGQYVSLRGSDEVGEVIGRAQYKTHTAYYLRYKAADSRLVEAWWEADALEAVPV